MSRNRDYQADWNATRDVLLGRRPAVEGDHTWLGHVRDRGTGRIDLLLLDGASSDDLASQRGGISSLISHYRKDHGLPVIGVDGVWSFDRAALGAPPPHDVRLAEELEAGAEYPEGTARQVVVNAYERNAEARVRCLRHYGSSCTVCNVTLSDVYGPIAEGFVHVHHLKPLSEIGGAYSVDPIRDLRPVCPNCHAIIHLGGGCRSAEDVRALLKREAAV